MPNSIFTQQTNNDILRAASKIYEAKNSPQMALIQLMVGGRDPKAVFYEQCKKKGVDPEQILNMLK